MNEQRVTVTLDLPAEVYEMLIAAPGYVGKEAISHGDAQFAEMCTAVGYYLAYKQPEVATKLAEESESMRATPEGIELNPSDPFAFDQDDKDDIEGLLEKHGLELPDLPDDLGSEDSDEADDFTEIDIGGDGGRWE